MAPLTTARASSSSLQALLTLVVFFVTWLGVALGANATPSFLGLGGFDNSPVHTFARSVSPDGRVVVGTGRNVNGGVETFRYTPEDGYQKLGHLPGDTPSMFSEGNGVSADGSIVVGGSTQPQGFEAFRWTESRGERSPVAGVRLGQPSAAASWSNSTANHLSAPPLAEKRPRGEGLQVARELRSREASQHTASVGRG